MSRVSRLEWRARRVVWASTGRGTDRMTRPAPGRSEPLRRSPPTESDETDDAAERWTIDDLTPLRHEERRIR